MKRNILLQICSFLFLLNFISAQEVTEKIEIGVIEHLDSIIPLDVKFHLDSNNIVSLKDIINKPTILILVYFDCPVVCPAILSAVSDVIEKTDLELGKDYQIITISFNDRDNPSKAANFKKKFLREKSKQHINDWIYLTGDSLNIFSVTEAVGFRFKKTGFDFVHPTVITVLSPSGKITRYLYGTRFLPFDFKMAIIEAQKGLSRPTVNKVLEFCFSYDPSGNKYVLDITRIAGIVIIFFAVLLITILILRSNVKRKRFKKLKY